MPFGVRQFVKTPYTNDDLAIKESKKWPLS